MHTELFVNTVLKHICVMYVPHFNCWCKQKADEAGKTMNVGHQGGIPIKSSDDGSEVYIVYM